MNQDLIADTNSIIKRIEKITNKTENKIDELQNALIDYESIIKKVENFRGYPISECISLIDEAKNKRKNVSRKYIHQQFLHIKELSLFRLRHNYGIISNSSK